MNAPNDNIFKNLHVYHFSLKGQLLLIFVSSILIDLKLFLDSEFDPSQHISQNYNNSNNSLDNVTKMREELKTLTKVVNLKRKELSIITINEDGLKNNIKHLEDIISIKVIMS